MLAYSAETQVCHRSYIIAASDRSNRIICILSLIINYKTFIYENKNKFELKYHNYYVCRLTTWPIFLNRLPRITFTWVIINQIRHKLWQVFVSTCDKYKTNAVLKWNSRCGITLQLITLSQTEQMLILHYTKSPDVVYQI
jgi:hypothetical protein